MEWLFVLMWPHYLPRRVYQDIEREIAEYFRQGGKVDG